MRAQEFLVERWTAATVKSYMHSKTHAEISTKDFTVTRPFKGCLLFRFKKIPDLTRAFFRMAEYYEGNTRKQKQNRHAELGTFIDQFVDRSGDVQYFKFWDGFNITGQSFDSWLGSVGQLADAERTVVAEIKRRRGSGPYSIIGIAGDSPSTLDHELFHAMWYLRPDFKTAVSAMMKDFKKTQASKKMAKILRQKLDYKYHVDEEIAAYLSDGSDLKMVFQTNPKEAKAFKEKFKEYKNEIQ